MSKTPTILKACTTDDSPDGMATTYTDPDTGAWVRIGIDPYGRVNPTENDEVYQYGGIMYLGHNAWRYSGAVDSIERPDDLRVTCVRCGGTGDDPERVQLTRGPLGPVVASGSQDAMDYLADRDDATPSGEHGLWDKSAECLACKGEGERPATLAEYLREVHGAVAFCESETGGYGSSARFVAWITSGAIDYTGTTDPQAVVDAMAAEYAAWARGDVYWIDSGDSTGSYDGPCYGYIGDEHAEAVAAETLASAIATVQERREANIERGES